MFFRRHMGKVVLSENSQEVSHGYSRHYLADACLFLRACDATAEVLHPSGMPESVLILHSKMSGYDLDTHSPGRFTHKQNGRASWYSRQSCESVPVRDAGLQVQICKFPNLYSVCQ